MHKKMYGNVWSWGGKYLVDLNETRKCYIDALREADGHDIKPLLEFVRS